MDGRVTSAQQRMVNRLRSELAELRMEAQTDAEKNIISKIEDDLYDLEDNIYELRVDTTELEEKKEFTTLGPLKRTVYGEGGITPDMVMEPPKTSKLETDILTKGLVFDFVVNYTAEHPDIDKNFEVSESVLREFAVYLMQHDIDFTEKEYEEAKPELRKRLRQELFTNLWGLKEGYRIRVADDPLVKKAVETLKEVTAPPELFRSSTE
jgi:carboxyl-terminal processing protease